MTIWFAAFLVVHGLIHTLGVAKAFGLGELPQLRQPISPGVGLLWLAAALLFIAAAVALFVWPRVWWIVGAAALVVSVTTIVPSWSDAKFGLAANALIAVGLVFGFLSAGPFSLRAEYDRDIETRVGGSNDALELVTEADLVKLPPPVSRYLRLAGVVGQPRVANFRVKMHGRIRSGPDARWMSFSVEQHNVMRPAARLFYLNAAMFTIPVQGYHRYTGTAASMRVRAAALVPVATASGPEMTRAETVTMLNDMCIMAPATLVDPAIRWEAVAASSATAVFTCAKQTVRADLFFNEAGELTNFVSADRYQTSPDGRRMLPMAWSTPVGGYRTFGSVRLPASGEARWHEPGGTCTLSQATIDDVQYNLTAPPR